MALSLLFRGAPVLLTTTSLTFSFSQYIFLRPFLDLTGTTGSSVDVRADRAQVAAILQGYIRREFPDGLATILVLYPLTWASAATNLAISSQRLRRLGIPPLGQASWRLYAAGLIFGVGHLIWAPRAKGLMEAIASPNSPVLDEKIDGKAPVDDGLHFLKAWLNVHVVRSLLADVPAFLSFTAGFLLHRPFR